MHANLFIYLHRTKAAADIVIDAYPTFTGGSEQKRCRPALIEVSRDVFLKSSTSFHLKTRCARGVSRVKDRRVAHVCTADGHKKTTNY